MHQRFGVGVIAVVLIAAIAGAYAYRPNPARSVVTIVPAPHLPNQTRRLIVYAHSMGKGMYRSRPVLEQLLHEPELAGSDLLLFDPQAFRLTPGPADDLATRLRAEIDAQWIRAGGYDDIILSGASIGSLLVRQAYLASAGRDPRQPRTIPWSDRVSRIVLMAGIGRGINIENEGRWKWVLRIGRYLPVLRESIVYDQLRGAEFVTAVRVGWIRYFAEVNRNAGKNTAAPAPIIVQLLGTQDDFVRREDNIDFDQFPNAFHLDIPRAQHGDIFRYGPSADSAMRYALFREAFVSRQLPHASPRKQVSDSVTQVIFLLHGIRSSRRWVKQLAIQLRRQLPGAEVVESSYGEMSILGFALPAVRRQNRRWLQDQYTEYLARHPSASFSVIAHSNGTYILGETLVRLPVMRFDRIVLLSSVLPTKYPWRQRHTLGQAGIIRSDRAADDRVAAIFCSGLHGLGMSDVGPSGWAGFDEVGDFLLESAPIPGGHTATVRQSNLLSVAGFIAGGSPAVGTHATEMPSPALKWASRAAPWIVFLVAVLMAVLGLSWATRAKGSARWTRFAALAAFALAVGILLDVL